MRRICLLAAVAVAAHAETHTLTLKQALVRALSQNPDVVMARTDEIKAVEGVRVARDPFSPRIGVGSGLAYSNGFPLSIEGSAPSAVQARINQYLFNRPQSYAVAQAKENTRAAGFATAEQREEVAFRVASLYIDAERAARLTEASRKQVENLKQMLDTAKVRVGEGRELPTTEQEANVNYLRASQRVMLLEADRDFAERNLAAILGYPATDSVRPSEGERELPPIPSDEDQALATALSSSKELRRLESNYQAKSLEIRGAKAARLPSVDLVAQYALFTKFSKYDEYFNKFQRNNYQFGMSFQMPFLPGPGIGARVGQAEADQQHIRAEVQAARNKITLDLHQSYQDIERAKLATQLAQAELDLARSQLSVVLAQMNEGRASLRQVEEARFSENEKWISFYDAQFNMEKAHYAVLRQTGQLTASVQ